MKIYSNKHAENYKKLEKLSLFGFLCNIPNFFLCLISAILGNTVVIWVDTLVSLSETLHSFIVFYVARKMYKETGDKYNFGMDRLEIIVSFICDILVSAGMFGVIFGAILNIQNPTVPSSSIALFCILKVSNSSFDLYFLIKQIKICREHPSQLNDTEKIGYRLSLINDVSMGIIALICFIFRTKQFVMYFSPIASIIFAIYFIYRYIKHIRKSFSELTDFSIPVKEQDEIYDIIMNNHSFIEKIVSVNCRTLNEKTGIEISLKMKDSATYKEINEYLSEIKTEIQKIRHDANVTILIGNTEDE